MSKRQESLKKFQKQLEFNKFCRMIIPYLAAKNSTIYGSFEKVLERLTNEEFKADLRRLMIHIKENPNDPQIFLNFAKNVSDTDFSSLFMNSLYDFSKNTKDSSVIAELGRIASEELLETVDEIIDFKSRKFALYPTKLTMASFLIVIGYAIGMIVDAVGNLGFG